MSYFKEFCESIYKTNAGYVPDLLDLETDNLRDLAMSAFLADNYGLDIANCYHVSIKEYKNFYYSNHESECQDAIDAYNQKIDDAKEKNIANDVSFNMFDPDYKFQRFNQAEIDAGFSGTGKEFC